jgi:Domain of unknown function (DUF4169)
MADIINLNRARKAKARDAREKVADVNRAKFGRTKVEKQLDNQEAARTENALDGHKRDT